MRTLHIMSLDFTYHAAIRQFESAVIERKFNKDSRLTLRVYAETINADALVVDRVIWFDRDYNTAFIIESVTQTLEKGALVMDVYAPHITSLLKDYITIPAAGSAVDEQTGTREQIVRAWVDNNAINPSDSARVQYPISLGSYAGYGETITDSTRYKNLADEISRVLSAEQLGWTLTIDLDAEEFIFAVIEGTNRTRSATPTNLLAQQKAEDDADWNTGILTDVEVDSNALQLAKDTTKTHDGTWLTWSGLTWQEVIEWA